MSFPRRKRRTRVFRCCRVLCALGASAEGSTLSAPYLFPRGHKHCRKNQLTLLPLRSRGTKTVLQHSGHRCRLFESTEIRCLWRCCRGDYPLMSRLGRKEAKGGRLISQFHAWVGKMHVDTHFNASGLFQGKYSLREINRSSRFFFGLLWAINSRSLSITF